LRDARLGELFDACAGSVNPSQLRCAIREAVRCVEGHQYMGFGENGFALASDRGRPGRRFWIGDVGRCGAPIRVGIDRQYDRFDPFESAKARKIFLVRKGREAQADDQRAFGRVGRHQAFSLSEFTNPIGRRRFELLDMYRDLGFDESAGRVPDRPH
jgi:hypothetical protein